MHCWFSPCCSHQYYERLNKCQPVTRDRKLDHSLAFLLLVLDIIPTIRVMLHDRVPMGLCVPDRPAKKKNQPDAKPLRMAPGQAGHSWTLLQFPLSVARLPSQAHEVYGLVATDNLHGPAGAQFFESRFWNLHAICLSHQLGHGSPSKQRHIKIATGSSNRPPRGRSGRDLHRLHHTKNNPMTRIGYFCPVALSCKAGHSSFMGDNLKK